jgi:aspartate beta-hydroxylase
VIHPAFFIMNPSPLSADIDILERQAADLERRGQHEAAFKLWMKVHDLVPTHVSAMLQLGQLAAHMGDLSQARHWLDCATQADPKRARLWMHLATVCARLGDDLGQEQALYKALSIEPYDMQAHLMRGGLFVRQGKPNQAATDFGAALAVAPPPDRLPLELRQALEEAQSWLNQHQAALGAHLDQQLAPQLAQLSPEAGARFQYSVDILVGRKKRFDSQPMRYLVPQLPAVEFFERHWFPWLPAVEAQTDSIREEFLTVWREDHAGFAPYIEYNADQPLAQWAELNHNPQWSAFHLIKDGTPVTPHAARCPRTMAAVQQTPQPVQLGKTPVALFSLLKPRTRIPPHVGASNARLVVHLPLVVPPDCGFRVGNITRQWVPGQAWVFDDTIEHEAWNNSALPRAVLIFDTWHPMLSQEERALISAMNVALSEFSRGEKPEGYDA